MVSLPKVPILKPEGHYCFACGTANPQGLKMEIKYVKPVLVGSDITVKGRLQAGSQEHVVRVKGEIVDKAGTLLTRDSGEYVILSENQCSSVSEKVREDVEMLFAILPLSNFRVSRYDVG